MPRICECCGQEIPPKLTMEEYTARAIPRLKRIDALANRIDFSRPYWEFSPDGELYNRLRYEQGRDEVDAGL